MNEGVRQGRRWSCRPTDYNLNTYKEKQKKQRLPTICSEDLRDDWYLFLKADDLELCEWTNILHCSIPSVC